MSQALVVLVLACRRRDLANPVSYINAEVRSGFNISMLEKLLMPCFQEKPLSYSL